MLLIFIFDYKIKGQQPKQAISFQSSERKKLQQQEESLNLFQKSFMTLIPGGNF